MVTQKREDMFTHKGDVKVLKASKHQPPWSRNYSAVMRFDLEVGLALVGQVRDDMEERRHHCNNP